MGRAIVRQAAGVSCSTSRSRTSTRSCASACAPRSPSCTSGSAWTTVYVTHDQTEAMTLGQRVAVMRDGKILQCDRPQELYGAPRTTSSSRAFIGSPAMNLVEAEYEDGAVCFGQYRVAGHGAAAGGALRARDPPRELRGRRLRARTADDRRAGVRCSRSSVRTPTSSSASTPPR